MEQNVLVEAVEAFIASNLWKAILVFILVYVSGSSIKRLANIVNEFVRIRTDVFGIGATIYFNRERAVIRNIGFRKIELYIIEKKESRYVRTAEWKNFELVVPDLNKIK